MSGEVRDVCVVGGGIAGVSAAAALAARGLDVVLVEREAALAHHTTGRSAASFLASYGGPVVRCLTRASAPLLAALEVELDLSPLLHPRPLLWVAPAEQLEALDAMIASVEGIERVDAAAVHALCPVVRPEAAAAAALEAGAADIDVLALHQGYVKVLRRHGGRIETTWPVVALRRRAAAWQIATPSGQLAAAHLVVAAGAWCDEVAALAGARPLGLRPLRRTLAVCPTAVPVDPAWPLVGDVAHTWYAKPEGPGVLVSPADETPSPACDARAEEEDVALALERVNEATTLGLRSVRAAWAGLRTFAPDRVPVCGEDPDVAGLWWLAGQGGFGIQTAPALAEALAGLMLDGALPTVLSGAVVTPEALGPARLR